LTQNVYKTVVTHQTKKLTYTDRKVCKSFF